MKFSIFQESRVGCRRSNQDRLAYCYSRDALLMVIADGMGGHMYGEIAAQIAVQYITHAFQREATPAIIDPTHFLSRAVLNAHHAILDYAFDKALPDTPRTTLVACIVQDGAAWWAHAGDSRLYLLRGGKVAGQTRDHSRVQMMIDQGLLDAEGAATHPDRNRVFSCLGSSHSPQVDYSRRTPLRHGDTLVMCTDGAWGPFLAEDLAKIISSADIMSSVPKLMDEAEERAGSKCDNLSLIAMTWRDEDGAASDVSVSTQTMALGSFTTQLDEFGEARPASAATSLSDDDIERAIAEIKTAIQKFSK
jgi:serine/threonine protein phosphatase PrpC